MEDQTDAVRIDKWLWAARFYKTRSLASQAVSGGKVHVNEQRAKASRLLHAGDVLHINCNEIEYTIVVEGVSERRGPAPEAQRLYRETEESIKRREQTASERRLTAGGTPSPQRRPNKRDRRLLIQLRGR